MASKSWSIDATTPPRDLPWLLEFSSVGAGHQRTMPPSCVWPRSHDQTRPLHRGRPCCPAGERTAGKIGTEREVGGRPARAPQSCTRTEWVMDDQKPNRCRGSGGACFERLQQSGKPQAAPPTACKNERRANRYEIMAYPPPGESRSNEESAMSLPRPGIVARSVAERIANHCKLALLQSPPLRWRSLGQRVAGQLLDRTRGRESSLVCASCERSRCRRCGRSARIASKFFESKSAGSVHRLPIASRR